MPRRKPAAPERAEDPTRPLTARQRQFAEVWAGNSTEAARRAGYRGSDSTLGSIGARLIRDERVIAIIAARRARGDLLDGDNDGDGYMAPEQSAGPVLSSDPIKAWEAVVVDNTIAMGIRMRAIERLAAHRAATAPNLDLAAHKAKWHAATNKMNAERHAREREARNRGECLHCGGRVNRHGRYTGVRDGDDR